jgi:hypothetical protein
VASIRNARSSDRSPVKLAVTFPLNLGANAVRFPDRSWTQVVVPTAWSVVQGAIL